MSPEESLVVQAIKHGHCLKFRYNGYVRVVEPHCLGISFRGNTLIRGFQVAGKSNSGHAPGWNLFDLSHAIEIQKIKRKASLPRQGYKQGDSAMRSIVFEFDPTKH